MKTSFLALALAGSIALPGFAAADPWKDESGHGHKGGPPPWAPAHGYRRKQGDRHEYRRREEKPAAEIRVSTDHMVIEGSTCNRETAGAVLGGIVGGVIGNRVGENNGNEELGTVAGAIIGVVVGKNIGKSMDATDASCAAHALDRASDGQTVSWRNPDSGVDYRLTPTETFKRDGLFCRRYRTEAVGRDEQAEGRSEACRTPDGKWQFRENTRT